MNALALGLYLLFYSHPYVDDTPQLPPLSDRVKFPERYTAGVQLEQWRIHIDRLEYLRRYNPGLPDLWLNEARRNARYYELLLLAHDTNFSTVVQPLAAERPTAPGRPGGLLVGLATGGTSPREGAAESYRPTYKYGGDTMIAFLRRWLTWQRQEAPRSPLWRTVRHLHLLQHPSCAACDTRKDLEVHHLVPYHVDPSLELDLNNLLTLCQRCHFLFGHFDNWQKVNPNARADAAAWLAKMRAAVK